MPEFIITACWVILFLACIYRFRFFAIEGINKKYTYAAFIFKFLLGFANYYLWLNVIGHGDSLRYFQDSKLVYNTLFQQPADYFQLLIGHSKEYVPEHLKYITEHLNIEWHVEEYNMVRLLAILNIFSFGSAWGNIVILSFISFTTLIALFKTIQQRFIRKQQSVNSLFILFFFIPTIVFWSAGLLKDTPVLILLCILFIQLVRLEEKLSIKRVVIICFALILIWLIRDYLIYLLLPNILILLTLRMFKLSGLKFYLLTTLIVLLALFAMSLMNIDLTSQLKREQSYFLLAPPDPDYQFQELDGTMPDVIRHFPYAFNNVLFRPNLLHSSDPYRIYQSIELFIIWLFIIWCLTRFRKRATDSNTQLFFLFFCLEALFVYGLIVTDADSLSRYRSVMLFFLLILAFINTKPFTLYKNKYLKDSDS